MERERRDQTRIYDVLRLLGHTGDEDEIAERIAAAAPRIGLRADAIVEDHPCSEPRGSQAWRENRAEIVSIIAGGAVRVGRAACIMPDAVGVPREPAAVFFGFRAACCFDRR